MPQEEPNFLLFKQAPLHKETSDRAFESLLIAQERSTLIVGNIALVLCEGGKGLSPSAQTPTQVEELIYLCGVEITPIYSNLTDERASTALPVEGLN